MNQKSKACLARARCCAELNNADMACIMYLMACKLDPTVKPIIIKEFEKTFGEWQAHLNDENDLRKTLNAFKEALAVFSDSSFLHFLLGQLLTRHEFHHEALLHLKTALTLDPNSLEARVAVGYAKEALVERWHFPMLNDLTRNRSFEKSLAKLVQPGKSVILDIGAGTGILSLIASRLGALRVYACEASVSLAEVCRGVIAVNNCDNISVITKRSTDMLVGMDHDIPQKVDIIVTEIFDAGLLGEGMLPTLQHALENLLSPSGQLVPSKAVVYVALLECSWIRSSTCISKTSHFKTAIIDGISDEPYDCEAVDRLPGGYRLLTPPKTVQHIDLSNLSQIRDLRSGKDWEISLECDSDGTIDGLILWFDLHLCDEVIVSTAPGTKCCWNQAIFPRSPLDCSTGDVIPIRISCKDHFTASFLQEKNIIKTTLEPSSIRLLNDQCLISWLIKAVMHFQDDPSAHLIDLSHCPIFAALFLNSCKCREVRVNHIEHMPFCQTLLGNRSPVNALPLDDYSPSPGEIVYFDCALPTGIFNTNSWLTILSFRESGCRIIPSRITVVGHLIESSQLLSMNRVLDENTLGFSIAKSINEYMVPYQLEISRATLEYVELSDVVNLLEIDTNSASDIYQTVSIPMTKAGTIHGLVYWFDLSDDWGTVSTCGQNRSQAAVVFDQPVTAEKDQLMSLTNYFKSGLLDLGRHRTITINNTQEVMSTD